MSENSNEESQISSECEHVMTIVVLGDSQVGKSCLISRFTNETFAEDHIATIGADVGIRVIQLDGKSIKIILWDTAGIERFQPLTKVYFRGAYGVIIVYDVTSQKSFENISMWMEEVRECGEEGVSKLLVGNKGDLTTQRQVDYETAKERAHELGMLLVETSAKDSTNVEQAIITLILEIQKRVLD